MSQTVRDFLTFQEVAVLSTHSSSLDGYPFGSIVPYDIDEQGQMIIFISLISEHFRNIEKNPKACLFVADSHGSDDPQPYARASALGEFLEVPESEVEQVRNSFWKRFPESPSRSLAHDFVFRRCSPQRIRWIGGFGDIRWVSEKSYQTTEFDPIAYTGKGIAKHMNQDHRDALAELLKFHHDIDVSANECELVGINSRGFSIETRVTEGKKRLEILFRSSLQEAAEVRSEMIELLKQCRAENNDG